MVALNFIVIPYMFYGARVGETITFSTLIISGTSPYTYQWIVEDPDGNLTVLGTTSTQEITFTESGYWIVNCTVTDSSPDAKGSGVTVYAYPDTFFSWEFYLEYGEYIIQCPECGEIDYILFTYIPSIGYYKALCLSCGYDGSMGSYDNYTDWIVLGTWW